MPTLEAARAVAARGLPVFPVRGMDKSPPLAADWPAAASVEVPTWPEGANIGVHCRGMVVVDIDPRKGGAAEWAALEFLRGAPITLTVRTPSGGEHRYYRLPQEHPEVANSVSRVAPGIDIRGDRGYVVGPGSKRTDGEYRVSVDAPLATAPQWLLDAAGPAPEASVRRELDSVPDAPEDAVRRAETWLRSAPRSVKGDSGDATAYEVACQLRDRGLSYQQACELMRSEAWDYGCGWGPKLESKPIASAYKYAQNEAGTLLVTAAGFPETAGEPPKPRRAVRSVGELALIYKPRPYLIKGLLHRGSHAVIYGEPGAGKTFCALAMAYAVATGREWMGRRVKQGTVLYLAYEGLGGIAARAAALTKAQSYGADEVPLYVQGASYDLRTKEDRAALGATIAELPEPPSLVVIDTLARAMCGGDENSAQDIGALNGAVAALVDAYDATVLLIHHSGKNKASGARGSSAILGAVDTELHVDDDVIRVTKQRDAALGDPIGFQLEQVSLGVDEDGDDITSCIVVPGEVRQRAATGDAGLRGNARRAWEVLCTLRPNNDPITALEWSQGCTDFITEARMRQTMYDIRVQLQRRGLLEVREDGTLARKLIDTEV